MQHRRTGQAEQSLKADCPNPALQNPTQHGVARHWPGTAPSAKAAARQGRLLSGPEGGPPRIPESQPGKPQHSLSAPLLAQYALRSIILLPRISRPGKRQLAAADNRSFRQLLVRRYDPPLPWPPVTRQTFERKPRLKPADKPFYGLYL